MKTNNRITKEELLSISQDGFSYFVELFPDLKRARINDRKCSNIVNHIRGESNASLSCYYKDGRWFLYDHADPDFSGDIFTIYGYVNEVEDFTLILEGLYKDLTGEEPPESNSRGNSHMDKIKLPEGIDYEIESIDFDMLGKDELNFIEKYQISKDIMKKYGSQFLLSYSFKSKSGKDYRINKQDGEVIIAHSYGESVKVYKPYDKEFKHQWISAKPKDIVYGIEILKEKFKEIKYSEDIEKNKSFQLILCAGEKDTLVLASLGFNSICLSSETSIYFPEILYLLVLDFNDLIQEGFELVVLYDLDNAGKKYSERIKEKQGKYDYKLRVLTLPNILSEKGGKDIADWISLGLSKEELIDFIRPNQSPVSDVFSHSVNKELTLKQKTCKTDCEDNLSLTTEFSEEIIMNLPSFFQKLVQPFDKEYKTMMLLSFITVLGSITKNVCATWRRDKLFPNLFTIIIAPPASGKSLIKWARNIIMPIEKFIIKKSEADAKSYQYDLELYKNGKIDKSELGIEPPFKTLLIPADITSAMWIKQISDNEGEGLMYDTEIDGLTESNSGNLRSFTDYLRKAYENEPLSLMRKTDRERILVEEGKMSMLLSGTPGQFMKLIPDVENGLFSRIIPCKFQGKNEWENAFEQDELDYDIYFEDLSKSVLEYYIELDSLPEPIKFNLSNDQLIVIDKVFSRRLNDISYEAGSDARANVMRLGAITVKIAMILTMFRRFEDKTIHNQNPCKPEDFESALYISEVILYNVLSTLKMMKDDKIEHSLRGKKLDYFYALPLLFTYRESQELAEELGINLKTAEKWIYNFRNKGFIINPEKGQYKKVA